MNRVHPTPAAFLPQHTLSQGPSSVSVRFGDTLCKSVYDTEYVSTPPPTAFARLLGVFAPVANAGAKSS